MLSTYLACGWVGSSIYTRTAHVCIYIYMFIYIDVFIRQPCVCTIWITPLFWQVLCLIFEEFFILLIYLINIDIYICMMKMINNHLIEIPRNRNFNAWYALNADVNMEIYIFIYIRQSRIYMYFFLICIRQQNGA